MLQPPVVVGEEGVSRIELSGDKEFDLFVMQLFTRKKKCEAGAKATLQKRIICKHEQRNENIS